MLKRLEGRKVLLVDDQAEVRQAVSMLLHHHGAVVNEAETAGDALELYRRGGMFDCVITDYNMPGMLGDAFALKLKTENPGQRVVMLSGFAHEVLRGGAPPWFIDVLLYKPCEISQLLDAVEPGCYVHEPEAHPL